MENRKIFTIGCDELAPEEFVALLKKSEISILVDIRSEAEQAKSKTLPQETLRSQCEQSDIVHHWAGRQLGEVQQGAEASRQKALDDQVLRNYADFMESEQFKRSMAQLINLSSKDKLALWSSQKNYSDSTRQLIADYLLFAGINVEHIVGIEDNIPHSLSPQARRESFELIDDLFI